MKEKKFGKAEMILSSIFEKALAGIRPPFMKLIVILAFTIMVVYLGQDSFHNLPSLVVVALTLFSFAFLAGILQYTEQRFEYSQKTTEELKAKLRDAVWERQQELKLIQVIDEYFYNDRELQELIQKFHLAFPNYLADYDDLSIQGAKLAAVCGLVNYCHRRGIIANLIEMVRLLRPDVIV